MAIAPTGAIYKALKFDGVSSRTYGVYITGEAVYNAPERDVEMITIPGRSGSFALDNGRFENIEVSYPAGIYADTEADFRQAISDFRNFLCSRKGYVRLQDEYNPDEYRMAVYKSGLDVDPAMLRAGEFTITFDCKPQRWLTSGETAVTIGEWGETETVSGDIVSVENPNGILAVKSLEVDLEPIQSGSGTPSPDNVRPISGHTDVVVSRTGKNLCDTSLVYNGYINVSQQKIASNANARTLYLPCKPNTTYTVSKQAGQRFVVAESTIIPTNNVVVSNVVSDYTASSITITTSASAKYLVAFVYLSTADTGVTADQMLATCQIELGSRATTYEPYQGDTYTIDLDGTRYGGTLDVTTGTLTVTDGNIASYNGEALPSTWISDRDVYTSGGTPTTGAHVVYKLATPTTVQLTAQQIDLLTGDNNIWSDSGDITLEYGQNPSVLVNPTLFESSPLLEATGYGVIGFNGYETLLEQKPIGDLVLEGAKNYSVNIPLGVGPGRIDLNATITVDTSALNTGDPITFKGTKASWTLEINQQWGERTFDYVTILSETGISATTDVVVNPTKATVTTSFPPIPFTFGTASTATHMTQFKYSYDSGSISGNYPEDVTITYDGAQTFTVLVEGSPPATTRSVTVTFATSEIDAYSSVIVTDPVFIDCDTGEAYSVASGTVVDANSFVTLGSDLPKLASGSNTVTFDNTITQLKVTPRWWKV